MAQSKPHTLRTAIELRFDTLAEMSRETGIDRTQIYRAIRGSGIAFDTARRIATALGLTLDGFATLFDQGAAAE
jgi:DNA-binding phage protein